MELSEIRRASDAMRTAIEVGDWRTAVRNCRILVRWHDSMPGASPCMRQVLNVLGLPPWK